MITNEMLKRAALAADFQYREGRFGIEVWRTNPEQAQAWVPHQNLTQATELAIILGLEIKLPTPGYNEVEVHFDGGYLIEKLPSDPTVAEVMSGMMIAITKAAAQV